MFLGPGPHPAVDAAQSFSEPDVAAVAIIGNSDVILTDLKLLRQREFGIEVMDSTVVCEGLRSRAGGHSALHASNSHVELLDFESTGDGDGINLHNSWGTIKNVSVRDCGRFLDKPGSALTVHGSAASSASDSQRRHLYVTGLHAHGGDSDAVQATNGAKVYLKSCKLHVSSAVCHALLSLGAGTKIEASDCHASGCGDGFTVGAGVLSNFQHCTASVDRTGLSCLGGTLVAEHCTSEGADLGAMAMSKDGCQYDMHLKDCRLVDCAQAACICSGKGVAVCDDCVIERSAGHSDPNAHECQRGVCVGRGPSHDMISGFSEDVSFTMNRCTVRRMLTSAVSVVCRGTVRLNSCLFHLSGHHGVVVDHRDAEVAMTSCVISECGAWGAHCNAGELVMKGCASAVNGFPGGGAFHASGTGSLVLKRCSSDKDKAGCNVEGDSVRRGPRLSFSEVLVHR